MVIAPELPQDNNSTSKLIFVNGNVGIVFANERPETNTANNHNIRNGNGQFCKVE